MIVQSVLFSKESNVTVQYLQDDWNVWSVEQLDWIRAVLASVTSWFDWQIYTESLYNRIPVLRIKHKIARPQKAH